MGHHGDWGTIWCLEVGLRSLDLDHVPKGGAKPRNKADIMIGGGNGGGEIFLSFFLLVCLCTLFPFLNYSLNCFLFAYTCMYLLS